MVGELFGVARGVESTNIIYLRQAVKWMCPASSTVLGSAYHATGKLTLPSCTFGRIPTVSGGLMRLRSEFSGAATHLSACCLLLYGPVKCFVASVHRYVVGIRGIWGGLVDLYLGRFSVYLGGVLCSAMQCSLENSSCLFR